MEKENKGIEEIMEKIAIALNPKKKTNKVFYFMILAMAFLVFDFFTSGMMINEYIEFRTVWVQAHSKEVIATAVVGLSTVLAWIGFDLKGTLFIKFIPKILAVFGFDDMDHVKQISTAFLEQTKTEAVAKVQSRLSDNLKSIWEMEKKLNTPKFLTQEERDKLLPIVKMFIEDIAREGKEYILNYDPNTELKVPVKTESTE